jgi:4-amino-4-deoxyprephenate dehydrogenase
VPTFGRAAVLGAAGGVGGLLTRLLRDDGTSVVGVDIAAPPPTFRGRWLSADARHPGTALVDAVSGADVLVVALPERAALAALDALVSGLPSNALVVDTMSVKTPVAAWADANGPGVGMLSINPLFAPDLGPAGRGVAAVAVRPGGDQEGLLRLLVAAGAHVLVMSADEHDRDVAASQVLTHAVALAAGRALVNRRDRFRPRTDTPPHHALALLLARILSGKPSVYWEIQRSNPYAGHVRQLLADAVIELDRLVAHEDEAAFVRWIDDLRAAVGDGLDDLANEAAALLASIDVSATDQTGPE